MMTKNHQQKRYSLEYLDGKDWTPHTDDDGRQPEWFNHEAVQARLMNVLKFRYQGRLWRTTWRWKYQRGAGKPTGWTCDYRGIVVAEKPLKLRRARSLD